MAIANGENDMDKNEVLKILETAKDKNGEVPMRLVRQSFEKLPEPCEDTISRQAAIDALDCINGVEEVLRALPSAQSEQQSIAGQKSDLIYRETARRIIDSPRSKSQMLTVLKCTPPVQPDRSLWFHIGELCVDESKGNITAEVAIKKIRALLRAETIYCKDCKYRDSFNYCTYKTRAGWITKDNGHCSEAERREE